MADEQLFKTALNGFNKDDVIAYIDGLNRAAAENQDWFDRQSKAMSDTIRRLTKENKELKALGGGDSAAIVEKLQGELARAKKDCEALNAKVAEQTTELDGYAKRLQAAAAKGADTKLRNALENVMIERDQLRDKLAKAEEQVAALQGQCEQMKSAQAARPAAGVSAQVEEALRTLKSQLDEANARNAQLTSALEQARAGAQNASGTPDEIRMQLEQAMGQAAQAQLEQTRLQTQLAQTQLQLEQARLQLSQSGSAYAAPAFGGRETVERISALEGELSRAKSENDYLRANMADPDELRTVYEKARLYDDIRNNVAKIVTDARKRAADMVAEAEAQSKQIMSSGMSSLTQIQRRIRAIKNEVENAQRAYSESSMAVVNMFNGMNEAVNIADNQLINLLGSSGTTDNDMWKREN